MKSCDKQAGECLEVKRPGSLVRTKSALSQTGCFLSKTENVGVGVFAPLPH